MSAKQRTARLERIAFDLKMEFIPKDEWGMLHLLLDFQLFSKGHSKKITNAMRMRDEWLQSDLHIFDYKFTTGFGKNRRLWKQTVFFMHSKRLALPDFLMKPEHIFHKIGEWLGLQKDIDFEEFPEFSKAYLLKGDDEDYIRHSMKEDVLRFFSVEKDWSLEGVNYFLIFYQKDTLLPPDRIKSFYEKGMKIFRMLKEEVKSG